MRIEVLITSHNRREATVECLRCLRDQSVDSVDVHVVLVDDGSIDDTDHAAREVGIPIDVLSGPGDLFWAAGMATAERAAMRLNPDALLWLNDDVLLDSDALQTLVQLSRLEPEAIVVGATRGLSGEVTYGGRLRASAWHPQRFTRLPARPYAQEADTFNGNVVLVPRAVRQAVGPIDGKFPHAYADDDYGLRARRVGVRVLQAPGTVGVCERSAAMSEPIRGLRGWSQAQRAKGLPMSAQVRYFRRHGGPGWPLILFGQQLRQVLPATRVAERAVQHRDQEEGRVQ